MGIVSQQLVLSGKWFRTVDIRNYLMRWPEEICKLGFRGLLAVLDREFQKKYLILILRPSYVPSPLGPPPHSRVFPANCTLWKKSFEGP